MARKESDNSQDAEYVEYEDEADNKKKVIVYGEYDRHRYSPLKKKRIKMSLMDLLIGAIIIAILGFIGYRSLQSYGAEARDDIRTGHLALIKEGLDKLVKEGKDLPEAYQKKEVLVNSSVIGAQGFAGEALFTAIGKKVLKDPLDSSYYIYYYSPQSKQYEVMAYLEGSSEETLQKDEEKSLWQEVKGWIMPTTDYRNRIPYSIGSIGNIIMANIGKSKNTPLNTLIQADTIDLSNLAKYEDIFYLGANCQDILTKFPDTKGKNGNHLILINGRITKAYCDMTTDGGGWTLLYANNTHNGSLVKDSYVGMRAKMNQGIYDLSDYNNPNLAGLLDITHFITNGAKEILVTNRVDETGKWVKFLFDTSASLGWALGKDVLGKTEDECIQIPNNGTWSVINNDKAIAYYGLTKIMNSGGNSWGVSHSEFKCNNQQDGKSVLPHVGFYSANRVDSAFRARSIEGIGGKWGGDIEYRYFIR